jgi:hypothetical protein
MIHNLQILTVSDRDQFLGDLIRYPEGVFVLGPDVRGEAAEAQAGQGCPAAGG